MVIHAEEHNEDPFLEMNQHEQILNLKIKFSGGAFETLVHNKIGRPEGSPWIFLFAPSSIGLKIHKVSQGQQQLEKEKKNS